MSAQAIGSALERAVAAATEGLAFTTAAPIAPTPVGEDAVWSWVKVTEPWPATLALAMPRPVAHAIATAMLGGEPGEQDERDAQKELTNVVAGQLVNHLIGKGLAVGLDIPRVGRGAPDVRGTGWVSRAFAIGSCSGALSAYWRGGETTAAASGPLRVASTPPTVSPGTETLLTDELPRVVGSLPERFGNYRILSHLGEGGMGQVYRAQHLTLERTVALKAMRPELSRDASFTARFLREARSSALIDHPHVVPVYDAGVESDHLYIAMRYMPGGDLSVRIREQGAMAEREALTMIARCLAGLGAIEAAGMVHRDIKPANILLDAEGSPRLGDLGLARSVDADDGLSRAGAPQGTPCFMSPEQARGAPVDIRSDIYSLGATLYAMLAAQPPFQGDSAFETVALVLTTEAPPLRQRIPAVSEATSALVARALAKDPRDRFANPAAFLAAVEEILAADGRSAGSGAKSEGDTSWLGRLLGGKRDGRG